MVHPRVYRGRFLRLGLGLAFALLVACGGRAEEPPAPDPNQGPAGLSDAAWGALLYRDRGCSGCHSLDSRAPNRSLGGRVVANLPVTDDDDEEPAPDEPTVHDQSWAEALLLESRHGTGDATVKLELSTPEARALSAFLQTCR